MLVTNWHKQRWPIYRDVEGIKNHCKHITCGWGGGAEGLAAIQSDPWQVGPHRWWRRGDGRKRKHKCDLSNVAWVSTGWITCPPGTSPAFWTRNNSFVCVRKVEFISIVEMLQTAAGHFVIQFLKSNYLFSTKSKNKGQSLCCREKKV